MGTNFACVKRADLAGKTALDKARAHMIIECCEDMIRELATFFFESNEERKVSDKVLRSSALKRTVVAFITLVDVVGTEA
jgi:hypothetical protein